MDISNNLKTVLDNINKDIAALDDSIPLSTSQLTNDSDFQTSTDVANALESKNGSPIVDVEEKNTSGAFIVDFTGAPIQKYDITSCPTGAVTFDYTNLSGVADNQASTIEVQLPVDSAVSSITFPNGTQVLDMPEELEPSETSGAYAYHDIVFRKQGNKVCTNYAYKYDEKPDYFWIECASSTGNIYLDDSNFQDEYDLHLEYSLDGGETWAPWKYYVENMVEGDRVYLRSTQVNATWSTNWNKYLRFASDDSSERFNVGGDIMTLVDGSGKTNAIPSRYYFAFLFRQFNVVDASELKLSARSLMGACYNGMFSSCTALTTAPKVIPNVTYFDNGVNYYSCFGGCTALTKSPIIKLTSLGSAYGPLRLMFANCTSLNEIEVHLTDWGTGTGPTDGWVSNVAATGTFKCPASLPIIRGISNIPEGWTIVNI